MPTSLLVALARLRAFLRPARPEDDFDEELLSHLAMAEEDKIRQGMSPAQARRAARIELGGLTQLREAGRDTRGLPWLGASWLDLKLGARMLRKSWGLTLVGGLAMTVVIAIAVVAFAVIDLQFRATLPLDQGDEVVALQTWDAGAHRRHRTSLADLEQWREALRSVKDVGAFRTVERHLRIGDGPAEAVRLAEMSASGFRVARVLPLVGRTLIEDDERPQAPPVVVLGYATWQSRFAGDPDIAGKVVQLGGIAHTVVGVMPQGFAFPVNHGLWIPLETNRLSALPDDDGEGVVFGRLADGSSLANLDGELTTLGLRAPSDPDQQLVPRAVPYPLAFVGDSEEGDVGWLIRLVVLLGIMLLVPPCANIAILVYARTVTRQGEFAARHALGASRGRIVSQLFLEMLVLTAAAATLALVVARLALWWAESTLLQQIAGGAPFWLRLSLSPKAIGFAGLLAVVAAAIAALVPALKATGHAMSAGLRGLGSRVGVRLGATWTTLVVAQVALTLATLPLAIELGWGTIRQGVLGPGFAAERFLTAQLEGEEAHQGHQTPQFETSLVRELQRESGIEGITVAEALPGDEPWTRVEVEGMATVDDGVSATSVVRFNHVDDAFFEVLLMGLLTGRSFAAGSSAASPNEVIVNQTFADQFLSGANPLGRRLRYVTRSGASGRPDEVDPLEHPWYEIVGVVEDRPANTGSGTIYHPRAGTAGRASLILRVQGSMTEHANRLRDIAARLDPTAVRVDEVQPLTEIYRRHRLGNDMGAFSLGAVTLSVLLLSAAGMYALMSFTVNQRRREIGIRSALGAQPVHLLAGVFRRAFAQVGTGAAIGIAVALLLDYYLPAENLGGWEVPGVVPGAAVAVVGIGVLAAAGPARRALRVAPVDELREG